jgi:hypothetical protein
MGQRACRRNQVDTWWTHLHQGLRYQDNVDKSKEDSTVVSECSRWLSVGAVNFLGKDAPLSVSSEKFDGSTFNSCRHTLHLLALR